MAGSGVNPILYLAFCASESAFQRWPGTWQGWRGIGLGHTGSEGAIGAQGQGQMQGQEQGQGQGQGQGKGQGKG